MPTKFLIVNKHTQKVYAHLEAPSIGEAKMRWAEMCGYERWADFEKNMSVSLDDVEFYSQTSMECPDKVDYVSLILKTTHESHKPPLWQFLVHSSGGWEFIRIFERKDGIHDRFLLPLQAGCTLAFTPERVHRWSEVPPSVKKVLEETISKTRVA